MAKLPSFILVCVFAILTAPNLCWGDAKEAFREIKPLIFQVKVSSNQGLDKSSYGTGFVVDRDGLLITNYHVVNDHIWKPEQNRIFVDIDKNLLEAKILAVDFINDLALLKIDQKFSSEIKISRDAIDQGDDIYSLGLPEDINWTVVRGVYNGSIQQGPYQLIYMSTPLNPGMSGGPTVNHKNQLVAVNVSTHTQAQQISFGVPSKFVDQLLLRYRTNPTLEANHLESLRSQLEGYQKHMKKTVLGGFAKPKLLERVSVPNFSSDMRCWGSGKNRDKELLYISQTEACSVDQNIPLSEGTSTGVFASEFSLLENKSMPRPAFAIHPGAEWGDTVKAMSVHLYDRDSMLNFTRLKCHRRRVQPTKGKARTISVCLQPMNPLKDFFDVYLELMIPLEDGRILHGEMAMGGLKMDSTQEIIKAVIEHDYDHQKKVTK